MGSDGAKRFDIFIEKHIGMGIRWDDWLYPIHLSIAFPFFTISIGVGDYQGPQQITQENIAEFNEASY